METRFTSRKPPSPKSYDSIQKYMATNAEAFVAYFRQVSESLSHIGEVFSHGRLFFPIDDLPLANPDILTGLTRILDNTNLLTHFERRLKYWRPDFSTEGIMALRSFFREYYFLPIEQSDSFKLFMTDQTAKSPGFSKERVSGLLSGALVFRIAGQWQSHNPHVLAEKSSLLCKLMNAADEPAQLQERLKTHLTTFITPKLETLLGEINQHQERRKKVQQRILAVFNDIITNDCFIGFKENGHILLATLLTSLFKRLAEDQKKRWANGLLLYCADHFSDDNHEMKELVKLVSPFVKKIKIDDDCALRHFIVSLNKLEQTQLRSVSEPVLKRKKSAAHLSSLWRSPSKQDSSAAQRKRSPSTPRPVQVPIEQLEAVEEKNVIPLLQIDLAAPQLDDASLPSPLPRTPGRIYARRTYMRRHSMADLFATPRMVDSSSETNDSTTDSDTTPRAGKQ